MLSIGHRGRPGKPRYGENTIFSFDMALRAGAKALKFDVRMTKDGQLIVIHDLDIARTTNGKGNVRAFTYEDLVQFNAGFGDRIPLLSEVLERYSVGVLLNIEIKESGIEKKVLDSIQSCVKLHPFAQKVMVSAFDSDDNDPDADSSWDQLAIFRKKYPDCPSRPEVEN